jgi:hypothetical protein
MRRVIKMSKAWIAALVLGIALAGCGGGSSSDSGSKAATNSGVLQNSGQTSDSQQSIKRAAALSWNAPLERQNQETLKMAELSGYVISYGQDPANLDQTVRVDNASTMEYTVENLADGTWYFSVQVEDNNGLISPPSDLVSKNIQS